MNFLKAISLDQLGSSHTEYQSVIIDGFKYEYSFVQKSDTPNIFEVQVIIQTIRFSLIVQAVHSEVVIQHMVDSTHNARIRDTAFCIALKALHLNGVITENDIIKSKNGLYNNMIMFPNATVRQMLQSCKILLNPVTKDPKLMVQGPMSAYKLVHHSLGIQMILFGDIHVFLPNSSVCADLQWYQWLDSFQQKIPAGRLVDVFVEAAFVLDNSKPSFFRPLFNQGFLFGHTTLHVMKRLLNDGDFTKDRMVIHSGDTRYMSDFIRKVTIASFESGELDLKAFMQEFVSPQFRDDPEITTRREAWNDIMSTAYEQMQIDKQWSQVDPHYSTLVQQIQKQLELDRVQYLNLVMSSLGSEDLTKSFLISLFTCFMDEYIMARMLRDTHLKFIVMYLGNAHVRHIMYVLLKCGFQLSAPFHGPPIDINLPVNETVDIGYDLSDTSQCLDYAPLVPIFNYGENTSKYFSSNKRKRDRD